MSDVRRVAWAEHVRPFVSRGAREGVSMSEGSGETLWWGAFDGGDCAGVAGMLPLRRGWRFRGFYVARPWRGQGYGRALMDAALAHAGDDYVEALTREPDAYARRGFVVRGAPRPFGVVRVAREPHTNVVDVT